MYRSGQAGGSGQAWHRGLRWAFDQEDAPAWRNLHRHADAAGIGAAM
ncbi:hypothetical protein LC55x_4587 [Lysobacter capsici]|nr:hypothetical protein LC55x_4587 [Lysobacter capsici]